ncbi:hypothetical protein [Grimontia sp. NTOU-MAR1]|uniref:hypothetical protein n=1 Tax=Grimontia sp. NTOU-MAR1 TaxID=3111011 RepID=UPI002DBA55DF|nr:hypothetical protein [Grimontia sp. NTOU-MAR1]WRV99003.1 hypothetical protein VP504_06170 [Grimontia sp. NTOU-MAR1]
MLRSRFFFLLLMTTLVGCAVAPEPALFGNSQAVCEKRLFTYYEDVEQERDFKLPYHQDGRFPHLAFDRFSTSLASELDHPSAQAQWLTYVSQKGKLQLETALALMPINPAEHELMMQCQELLFKESINNPRFWNELKNTPPTVPTSYEHWKRVLGAYPVASLVAKGQIEDEQERIKADFGRPLTQPFRYGEAPLTHGTE